MHRWQAHRISASAVRCSLRRVACAALYCCCAAPVLCSSCLCCFQRCSHVRLLCCSCGISAGDVQPIPVRCVSSPFLHIIASHQPHPMPFHFFDVYHSIIWNYMVWEGFVLSSVVLGCKTNHRHPQRMDNGYISAVLVDIHYFDLRRWQARRHSASAVRCSHRRTLTICG